MNKKVLLGLTHSLTEVQEQPDTVQQKTYQMGVCRAGLSSKQFSNGEGTHLKSTTEVVFTGSGSRRDHLNILMRDEISLLARSGGRLIIITLGRGSASRAGGLLRVVLPARECLEVIGLVDFSAMSVESTNSLRLNFPRRSEDNGDILMVVFHGPLHNTSSVGRSVGDEAIRWSWDLTSFVGFGVPDGDRTVSKGEHVFQRDIRFGCENADGSSKLVCSLGARSLLTCSRSGRCAELTGNFARSARFVNRSRGRDSRHWLRLIKAREGRFIEAREGRLVKIWEDRCNRRRSEREAGVLNGHLHGKLHHRLLAVEDRRSRNKHEARWSLITKRGVRDLRNEHRHELLRHHGRLSELVKRAKTVEVKARVEETRVSVEAEARVSRDREINGRGRKVNATSGNVGEVNREVRHVKVQAHIKIRQTDGARVLLGSRSHQVLNGEVFKQLRHLVDL
jgi:hypothetical protein